MVIIANLFASRFLDENTDLSDELAIVGAENDYFIKDALNEASVIFAAWGEPPFTKVNGMFKRRIREVKDLLHQNEVSCVRTVGEGKYPLLGTLWPDGSQPIHSPQVFWS